MGEGTIGKGERTEVYFRVGTFQGSQEPRYTHAPFAIVKLATDSGAWAQGIMTTGQPWGGLTASILNGTAQDYEDQRTGNDFGFIRLGDLLIEEHQMGDLSDNILGLHRIGYL